MKVIDDISSPKIISGFFFRVATRADIPALRVLIEESVRTLNPQDYSAAEIEGSVGRALGLDAQLIEDGTYFVASPPDDLQTLVGCGGWSYRKTLCGGDQLADREMTRLNPRFDAAKIRGIYVHPRRARQGLGSAILKHCEDAAIAAGFRHFEMGSTLTGAHLYALRGYLPRERVDISLPNGAVLPVLRMTKTP